jgi:YbbR domain-containing protein
VRRVTDFLLRNWPLRLGAIVLATLLYSGLVLGQNVRTWTGEVPVDVIRPPAGAAVLSDLDPVTLIRFRAPLDVGVLSPDKFRASVDLSRVEAQPGGRAVEVPVTLVALDQRVQIVDYQPQRLEVRLDPVETRQMPVTVTLGSVPDGLNIGPPQVEPSSVTVRGASSRVDVVTAVVARVPIDASALNVDRDIELIPVDANGNQVSNVEIDPERARVRIAVARELANLTLPVVPQLTGSLAPGYRITSVVVEPIVVTVSGEEAIVARLDSAPTQPIDLEGRSTDLEAMVGLALPDGVAVTGNDQVRVVLTLGLESGSQTYRLGIDLEGEVPDLEYSIDSGQASATVGGALVDLDALNPAALRAVAEVTGLGPGTHTRSLTVDLPEGLELIAISPAEAVVTISVRAGGASPTARSGPLA